MDEKDQKRIFFELEPDEDGYPPDKWESMWAYETAEGLFCVDNIPFYVMGISSGDVISAKNDGEKLIFENLVRPSSNSVIRIYVSDLGDVQGARNNFRTLGCQSELSHVPKLFAVEIPGDVDFYPVANLLAEGDESGRWAYEEGVLRHEYAAS
jgi:Domain of unknown function (DUF4265)